MIRIFSPSRKPKEEKNERLVKFGKTVRRLRKEWLKISQEEFAEKVGCHRTYIGMIERAEKNLTIKNIFKVADAFEISVSRLFKEMEIYG